MAIKSVLTLVSKDKLNEKAGALEMMFRDGVYGAGQQVLWNSSSMHDGRHYMFQ